MTAVVRAEGYRPILVLLGLLTGLLAALSLPLDLLIVSAAPGFIVGLAVGWCLWGRGRPHS